jgi:hypothetical protein
MNVSFSIKSLGLISFNLLLPIMTSKCGSWIPTVYSNHPWQGPFLLLMGAGLAEYLVSLKVLNKMKKVKLAATLHFMQRQCICNKIAGTCDFVNKSI